MTEVETQPVFVPDDLANKNMQYPKPFTRKKLTEEKKNTGTKTYSVRLNDEEVEWVARDGRLLNQRKIGTTLKFLARIGHRVLHDPLTGGILREVTANLRRNKKTGLVEYEPICVECDKKFDASLIK